MGWLHKKMRLLVHHVCAPFTITPKSADSGSSRKGKSCGGLVKLRDEVQSCGYEDVEVMWKILNAPVPQVGVGVAAPRRRRVARLRRPPWRSVLVFWSHHNHTHKTSTASTCASVSSSSSSSSSCFFSG